MKSIGPVIATLIWTLPCAASAADPTPVQIEEAISRALGVDPAKQSFLRIETSAKGNQLVIDRNAFTHQTGINILGNHLPETMHLNLRQANGNVMIRPMDSAAYTAKSDPLSTEQGSTSARNYLVNAGLVGGVLGMGSLEVELAGMGYRSSNGARETTIDITSLSLYKNQRPFNPTTIQLGWSGKGLNDIRSSNGKQVSRLHVGSFNHNLIIGATDISKAIAAIWRGESMQNAVLGHDGAAVRDALAKARAIELNYRLWNLAYHGAESSYLFDNFSFKFQSSMCGGCEGRFDIGIDRPQVYDDGVFFSLSEMIPEHVYASGAVSGLDLVPVIASKDALINPFQDDVFSYPKLAHQDPFSIPAFKLSAFDGEFDIAATGFLDVRYDHRWMVTGKIEAVVKKGEEKIGKLLAIHPQNPKAAEFTAIVRSAFATGRRGKNGTLEFTIDIKDNAVSVNGQAL